MALIALLLRRARASAGRAGSALVALGIFGASLFFGDSMITPAISVLSAVEGLEVVQPSLDHLVVPIAAAILIGAVRSPEPRYGNGRPAVRARDARLVPRPRRRSGSMASSPTRRSCARFADVRGPVLPHDGLTGVPCARRGRARGHRGRGAVRGHGTLRPRADPARVAVRRLPRADAQLPRPGRAHPRAPAAAWPTRSTCSSRTGRACRWSSLACAATVIASQAVISGAFSVTRQAVQLGYLPRLRILHTSHVHGQIYVPFVNWTLFVAVLILVFAFQRSAKLASAYGIAVTGTITITLVLFLVLASVWGRGGPGRSCSRRIAVRGRRRRVPRREPREDLQRRLAADRRRRRRLHRARDLAAGAGDRHPQPRTGRRLAAPSSSRSCGSPAAGRPGARHRGVPQPQHEDHAARDARERRAQPGAARVAS